MSTNVTRDHTVTKKKELMSDMRFAYLKKLKMEMKQIGKLMMIFEG